MKMRLLAAALAGSSLFLAGAASAQQKPVQSAAAKERPLTLAERQAAWSRNKAEYRRRVVQEGQPAADRWLDQQARGTKTESRAKPRTRASMKDCKKVRWVNRATPGFGGGPMTMSRVAVCAD